MKPKDYLHVGTKPKEKEKPKFFGKSGYWANPHSKICILPEALTKNQALYDWKAKKYGNGIESGFLWPHERSTGACLEYFTNTMS